LVAWLRAVEVVQWSRGSNQGRKVYGGVGFDVGRGGGVGLCGAGPMCSAHFGLLGGGAVGPSRLRPQGVVRGMRLTPKHAGGTFRPVHYAATGLVCASSVHACCLGSI
jgi:hypothetical protein